jgi:hypothetical protein
MGLRQVGTCTSRSQMLMSIYRGRVAEYSSSMLGYPAHFHRGQIGDIDFFPAPHRAPNLCQWHCSAITAPLGVTPTTVT